MIHPINYQFPGSLKSLEFRQDAMIVLPDDSSDTEIRILYADIHRVVYQNIIKSQYTEARLQVKVQSSQGEALFWLPCHNEEEKQIFTEFWKELHLRLQPYREQISFHQGEEKATLFWLMFGFVALISLALNGAVLYAGIINAKGNGALAFLLLPFLIVLGLLGLRLIIRVAKPGPYDPDTFEPKPIRSLL